MEWYNEFMAIRVKRIITKIDKKGIEEALERGVENIYPSREALAKVLKSGKKLRIYNGIDPTGKLHLGHGVVLNKLQQFQELGHEIIVLIGDFTGMVGDPTDKLATRKPLTRKQVLENAKNYKKLIGKVLDLKKTKFKFNSEWLGKMNFADLIKLASEFTVQRLLERDMFKKRIAEGKPIHLHEFLYPLMQGYDSVAMNVDMEVGGNDQTFNMLAGRDLMKALKNKEKFVLTLKLLEDPTGKKMGKTEGNMVNLDDKPDDMYGKVMSWPDGLIIPALEIATNVPWEEVMRAKKDLAAGQNPKNLKMLLAFKIVEMYYGKPAAIRAKEYFKRVFEKKLNPDKMPEFKLSGKNIIDVMVLSKLAKSRSDAKRLIEQGAIEVDGERIKTFGKIIEKNSIIQKGKRFFTRII